MSTMDRRAFVLRRLSAIAAVVPVGVFVVVHLLVQATALAGPSRYERVVTGLARLPLARTVELVFVILPLAYHALYGLVRVLRRDAEGGAAWGYGRPRLDVLHRVTSLVLFVFVGAHVWSTRGSSPELFHTQLSMTLSSTWAGVPWVALGYLAGVAAAAFHLSYGVYAVLASRGRAGRTAALRCGAGGLLLFVVGAATITVLAGGGSLFPDRSDEPAAPCGDTASP